MNRRQFLTVTAISGTTAAGLVRSTLPIASLAWLGQGRAQTVIGERLHGYALFGELKYLPGFPHFDYVDPVAPKGGDVRRFAIGSYDSLNPFILKGRAPAAIGLLYDSLLEPSLDEASTAYGLVAEALEIQDDRRGVVFHLRPEARWHDGRPLTAEDVVFSFDTLKAEGRPFYRSYWRDVSAAEVLDRHRVRFALADPGNRELPGIIGQLLVLPRHHYHSRDFNKTTLEPPLGSGPYRILELDAGNSITYGRVVDYWGRDLPVNVGRNNFGTIRFDYYLDETVAFEAFKARQYDFRAESLSKVWATGYDFPAVRKGLVAKEKIPHSRPTGMQAFVLNTRRAIFEGRKVREALGYAFDFEWSNAHLFYGQYSRTTSFFSNSELASSGIPSDAELAILAGYRGRIPDEVFSAPYRPPATDGSGNIRKNLRRAQELLEAAGYSVEDGKLADPKTGALVEIEFLLVNPAFERVVAPMIGNLGRLGIEARMRLVDSAQYQNRLDNFDFDIVVSTFGQSLSPGNEQLDYWHSSKAEVPGSGNLIGVKDPVVDELIALIITAPDRESLIVRTRALDRVLLWSHYVIPHWHIQSYRVAYWNKFGRPAVSPEYGLGFDTWWVDNDKEQALASGMMELKRSD